jgi:replicative DNA helicase
MQRASNDQREWREPAGDLQLHNIEGEAVVLGALMMRNAYADNIADVLEPEDFYEPIHGALYAAIIEAVSAGRSVSPVTLHPIFANDPRYQELGGPGYLAGLTGSGAILLIDIKSQAEGVAELAARRRLIDSLDETRSRVSSLDVSLLQLVDEADAGLVAAVERRDVMAQPTISEAMGQMLDRIAKIQANDGKVGTECGISDIDRLVGGFDAGQLIVLAGRPGMGKTAVACGVAKGLSENGAGVLFVSLEMGSVELAQRVASDLCYSERGGIPFEKIVNATVDDLELQAPCPRHVARPTACRCASSTPARSRWPASRSASAATSAGSRRRATN